MVFVLHDANPRSQLALLPGRKMSFELNTKGIASTILVQNSCNKRRILCWWDLCQVIDCHRVVQLAV
jgi:hypothetical protein